MSIFFRSSSRTLSFGERSQEELFNWWSYTFLFQGRTRSEIVDWLHDYILLFLSSILFLLSFIILYLTSNTTFLIQSPHIPQLEFIWTILPAAILLFIAFYSLSSLYIDSSPLLIALTVKVIGHQWFWSYDLSDLPSASFWLLHKVRAWSRRLSTLWSW